MNIDNILISLVFIDFITKFIAVAFEIASNKKPPRIP
jgi:hypothetical protein